MRLRKSFIVLTLMAVSTLVMADPPDFDSGSTGVDLALDASIYTLPAGMAETVIFDPAALGLDADGDNTFHFTTIDIPAMKTLVLRTIEMPEGKPVVWLASGAVNIEGTLSLNGADGHHANDAHLATPAGAGGFTGGVGASPTDDPHVGNGPGGGGVSVGSNGAGAGHILAGTSVSSAMGGAPYGNQHLLPMLGGSGGGGGGLPNGAGGGSGGGAILIASSTDITINGTIEADGGEGGNITIGGQRRGGAGSGGAIRLMCETLDGTGTISVDGGVSWTAGSAGRIRVEAFVNTFGGAYSPGTSVTAGTPSFVFNPVSAPAVRVTSIGGVAVPAMTTGSFLTPDLTIDASVPVTLDVETTNMPLDAEITITLNPEVGASTVVVIASGTLSGTLASATATSAAVTIPHGLTRFTVTAEWTP
ncbi:MAG: hypothetical protein AAF581_05930 [Planctomycetota bacterium]